MYERSQDRGLGIDSRPSIDPEIDNFPSLLRAFRERDKFSRNRLAYEVGCDPSYLTRIEHGDREPPREHIVFALGRSLRLSLPEFNRLLTSAGYSPLERIAENAHVHWNDALQAVVDVKASEIPQEEIEGFNRVVRVLADKWIASASNGSNGNGKY